MAAVRPADETSINEACRLLAAGELVAIPTETVYGLAANAWDESATKKIFAAKGRPSTNPLIVHIASADRLDQAVCRPIPPEIQCQLDCLVDLWPGPLTIVMPAGKKIPMTVTAGRATVAVRVPAHPFTNQLLRKCPFPIAAPSANRSQYVSPTTAQHCLHGLANHVAMIIDGGPCQFGVESTIVSLVDGNPRLLRPGGISAESLAARLNVSVMDFCEQLVAPDSESESMPAPGMMRQHYSPSTPLRLMTPTLEAQYLDRIPPHTGRIAFSELPPEIAERYEIVETLSRNGDHAEISRGLFAAIRRLDELGLSMIVCDACEPTGLGRAIMDRLQRAASR